MMFAFLTGRDMATFLGLCLADLLEQTIDAISIRYQLVLPSMKYSEWLLGQKKVAISLITILYAYYIILKSTWIT